MQRTLETGQSGDIEYTLRKIDGEEFPGEVNVQVLKDATGEPVGFVASKRDISERKKAEERLKQSERKYRMMADNTVDFITLLTLRGTYTYISPSHKLLGYEAEELLGKSGLDFIHPDDRKRLAPALARYAKMRLKDLFGLKNQNYSERFEFRFPDKDRNWHDIEATGNLVDAFDGDGLNVMLVCRDVTERKRAENALKSAHQELEDRVRERTRELETANRELASEINERKRMEEELRSSEERLKIIFRYAPDAYYLNDAKGIFVDGNEAAEKMIGYKKEELIGKSFLKLKLLPPNQIGKAAALLAQNVVGKPTGPVEFTLFNKQGDSIMVEIRTFPVKIEGNSLMLGIARDISERKRAEEALKSSHQQLEERVKERTADLIKVNQDLEVEISERKKTEADLRAQKDLIDRILDNTPNAVLVINKRLDIVLANTAFNDAFELEKGDVEGQSIKKIISSIDWADKISDIPECREHLIRFEFRHKISNREKMIVASMLPMQKDEVLLVLVDVTEERERQERLYLTDRLASVGEMASGIAHELNNPLTGVIAISELLMDADVPDDIQKDIADIYSESHRAAQIVRNLLTFARKHTPERQRILANRVVEDVLKLRSYELNVHNIEVDLRLEEQLPDVIFDYFQMQQVFLNIIINAENAMIEANNCGKLIIETQTVDDVIRISFTDDGPGIPPESLGRIFDPFYTTKEVGKGTGLGLSICYGIVTDHGGKLYAQNVNGKGASFIIELPIPGK
jgi:PAS domain S-box-containing protein